MNQYTAFLLFVNKTAYSSSVLYVIPSEGNPAVFASVSRCTDRNALHRVARYRRYGLCDICNPPWCKQLMQYIVSGLCTDSEQCTLFRQTVNTV
jgi:hypothetical protein